MQYKDGEPCNHKGCLNHVTHPCEGCGRIAGVAKPERFEVAELDFTQVTGNETVKAQGKIICIKTKNKGFFSPDLECYPSRQDLAVKTKFTSFNMTIAKRLLKQKKEKQVYQETA